MPDCSVVLPIHDERESIPVLLRELTASLRPLGRSFEIVAVDDGSTDGSAEVLRRESARTPELRTIQLSARQGQGSALQRGFDEALGHIIVSLDADLENDPRDIPRLLEVLDKGGCDVVCGWRRGQSGRSTGKQLGSAAANWLRRALIGEKIHDVGCTLRAYRREALGRVRIAGAGHRMLTARLHLAGLTLREVPVAFRPRRFGRSKYGTADRLRESGGEFLRLAFLAATRRIAPGRQRP